jgi:hypothetical protein
MTTFFSPPFARIRQPHLWFREFIDRILNHGRRAIEHRNADCVGFPNASVREVRESCLCRSNGGESPHEITNCFCCAPPLDQLDDDAQMTTS